MRAQHCRSWTNENAGCLSSTVHGLVYISTTRQFSRLFWLAVVVCGFTVAGVMISQSVVDWRESPVSTSTETLDIANITFPPVIVCPPKVGSLASSKFQFMALGNLHQPQL